MNELWKAVQELSGTTISMRDLHEAVDEIPTARVVTVGRMTERDGYRFQTVRVVRHGFRPITLTASAKAA